MNKIIALFSMFLLAAAFAAPRVIEMKVEKIDGKATWIPGKIEVTPGEMVRLKVDYSLDGGFEFHGFSIQALNLVAKVDRNKPFVVDKQIPSEMKEGEYPISCHFHPAHVGATLVVKKKK